MHWVVEIFPGVRYVQLLRDFSVRLNGVHLRPVRSPSLVLLVSTFVCSYGRSPTGSPSLSVDGWFLRKYRVGTMTIRRRVGPTVKRPGRNSTPVHWSRTGVQPSLSPHSRGTTLSILRPWTEKVRRKEVDDRLIPIRVFSESPGPPTISVFHPWNMKPETSEGCPVPMNMTWQHTTFSFTNIIRRIYKSNEQYHRIRWDWLNRSKSFL